MHRLSISTQTRFQLKDDARAVRRHADRFVRWSHDFQIDAGVASPAAALVSSARRRSSRPPFTKLIATGAFVRAESTKIAGGAVSSPPLMASLGFPGVVGGGNVSKKKGVGGSLSADAVASRRVTDANAEGRARRAEASVRAAASSERRVASFAATARSSETPSPLFAPFGASALSEVKLDSAPADAAGTFVALVCRYWSAPPPAALPCAAAARPEVTAMSFFICASRWSSSAMENFADTHGASAVCESMGTRCEPNHCRNFSAFRFCAFLSSAPLLAFFLSSSIVCFARGRYAPRISPRRFQYAAISITLPAGPVSCSFAPPTFEPPSVLRARSCSARSRSNFSRASSRRAVSSSLSLSCCWWCRPRLAAPAASPPALAIIFITTPVMCSTSATSPRPLLLDPLSFCVR
mmetsp:Transcript_14812/g.62491  ORF Transcript_14812/g.62491 Transcript_14812/m.62491 type:complete len:410 (-) Transcript_14812:713-1942(-)